MASCKLGHVYIVQTVLTKPPKEKYALCICPKNQWFIWFNSNPRPHGKDQLQVTAKCHELIKKASYIDLSGVVAHPQTEIDKAKEFECIDEKLCRAIIEFVAKGLAVMPKRHAELVSGNLETLFPKAKG